MGRNLFHLLRIARVFTRHGLDEFVSAIHLFRPYTFLLKVIPGKKNRSIARGDRLRMALEELGPVFIKFGQVLSTRPDLLPEDIARSLTKLQDQVPPFPGSEAVTIIEKAYGDDLDVHFRKFETESTASASVAQVHYAELHNGTQVIVKVLRPGIESIIERDLELLHTLADLAERHWSQGKRLKPKEIIEDYDRTIHDELDLMREAASASQLRINFENSDLIYVPEVFWPHTTRNVMVMERIYGIPIRDIDRIKAAGIDMKKLAHDGVEIFFTQAFRDGFFHADMHPGNIFVSETGQYRAVDFGIMGTLGTADKRYLAENLLAFFNRDYHRVADAHIRAGWVPPSTNAEQFEAAIRTVCEPIFSPQLVLLQKTILNIEGLGRQLYPDLDLWETAKPFLEKWMNEQIGPKAAIKTIRRELPNLFTLAPELPGLAHQLMYKLKNDELTVHTRDREVQALRTQNQIEHKRTTRLVLGFGFGLGALMFLPDRSDLSSILMPGIIMACASLLSFIMAFRCRIRSD